MKQKQNDIMQKKQENENIIINSKNNTKKREWIIIGGIKKWGPRTCSGCNKKLYYSDKGKLKRANVEKSDCKICSKLGKNNPNYGKSPSKETREKISESERGKRLTDETKNKISKSHIGLLHTDESKRKMSES